LFKNVNKKKYPTIEAYKEEKDTCCIFLAPNGTTFEFINQLRSLQKRLTWLMISAKTVIDFVRFDIFSFD
jgi:hypothetical protein